MVALRFHAIRLFAFRQTAKATTCAEQNMEIIMTTTENYVYRFESALDTTKDARTAANLLESLHLNLPPQDNRWSQLEKLVVEKQNAGYDFNRGRATLAVLCQQVLNPLVEEFEVYGFGLCQDDDAPWKKSLVIELGIKGSRQHYSEPVRKSAQIAFPHVLKSGLQKFGLSKALNGIRVEDGNCTKLDDGDKHQSLLHFCDHYRRIGWWSVGVGKSPLAAIYSSSVTGYLFALDPRREQIPINQNAAAWHEIDEHARRNPREFRKHGVCYDLIF